MPIKLSINSAFSFLKSQNNNNLFQGSVVKRYHKHIIQGGQKKTGISRNMAITTLKSIRKGKNWCFGKFSLNAAGLTPNLSKLVENGLEKLT